jgi:hypothetical protein
MLINLAFLSSLRAKIAIKWCVQKPAAKRGSPLTGRITINTSLRGQNVLVVVGVAVVLALLLVKECAS